MKVFVTGTRGVPGVPGGIESHCEQLYPLLVDRGVEVKLSRRAPYVEAPLDEWQGIELIDLYTPCKASLESLYHTAFSVFRAKEWQADIVHIHAVGPAIMTPLARLLGMKVVVTNHGPDYNRLKWGRFAKIVLKLGEYLGCKFATEVIVVSETVREIVTRRCKRPSNVIYNGVTIPALTADKYFLDSLGLKKRKYLLAVARLVPEKGLHDLIDAYEMLATDFKLVIAGGSDHDNAYSISLKTRANRNDNILMPGYITGHDLEQLFTHASLFVLPSYHEGLSISLLEALSYGLPAVVSDIPANREIGLASECYFFTGDTDSLKLTIERELKKDVSDSYRESVRQRIGKKYNWDKIADQTVMVYKKALS